MIRKLIISFLIKESYLFFWLEPFKVPNNIWKRAVNDPYQSGDKMEYSGGYLSRCQMV
jgi:hypothetical protein